jgi:tetratricopeptide (TPR) repeat protein
MTADTQVEVVEPGAPVEEGEVLITIGTSEAPGIIRRWGTVSKAIGDLSLEAVVRGAVDPRVLELMRERRPAQFESESRLSEEIKGLLERGYRIFVHDGGAAIDCSRAAQVRARGLLKKAAPEYEAQTFYTLHLVLEDEVVLSTGEEPQPEEAEEKPASMAAEPRLTKEDLLREQFTEKVKALDLKGLFVGNFGFQKDQVVDVSRLSTLSPQTVSAYLVKANSFRQNGEYEKALSYYRVLLKSDPDNADFRYLYGKTLMEMGRTQAAVECLQRAKELGHESATRELERLTEKQTSKPGLHFLRFWRRSDGP